jgi:putative chitinase
MTPETLLACMPYAGQTRAALFAPLLTDTCQRWNIKTPRQLACFLAHVCHESGSLVYLREIADGRAYEGRADLGNTQPGDGTKYRGRGLPQITGRLTYGLCGEALGLDLLNTPTLLEEPRHACEAAGWFWRWKALGEAAELDHFWTTCKRWNGGSNGADDRIVHWLRIRKVLSL